MNTLQLFPIYQGLFRFHFVIHISINCFVYVLMIFLKCQMLICQYVDNSIRYLIGQPGKYEDTVPLARRMKKSFGMDVDENMEQLKNMKKNGW